MCYGNTFSRSWTDCTTVVSNLTERRLTCLAKCTIPSTLISCVQYDDNNIKSPICDVGSTICLIVRHVSHS